jgi:PKD repeat protein
MDVISFSTNVTDPAFNLDASTGTISFFPTSENIGFLHAKIIVEDDKGGKSVQNISIRVWNVNDKPSVPIITIEQKIFLNVQLSASEVLDEDGDELTYTWDFGDDSPKETGRFVSHEYSKKGNYTVTVTVSDGNQGFSSASVLVDVEKSKNGKPTNGGGGSTAEKGDFLSDNFMLLALILIILIIVIVGIGAFLVNQNKRKSQMAGIQGEPMRATPPEEYTYQDRMELLEQRLLRGEINSAEYRDLKAKYEAEGAMPLAQPPAQYPSTAEQEVTQTYIPPQEEPPTQQIPPTQQPYSQTQELSSAQAPPPTPQEYPPQPPFETEQTYIPPPTGEPAPPPIDEPYQEQSDMATPTTSEAPTEPDWTPCPVCGVSIQVGAPVCDSCNTPMDWVF